MAIGNVKLVWFLPATSKTKSLILLSAGDHHRLPHVAAGHRRLNLLSIRLRVTVTHDLVPGDRRWPPFTLPACACSLSPKPATGHRRSVPIKGASSHSLSDACCSAFLCLSLQLSSRLTHSVILFLNVYSTVIVKKNTVGKRTGDNYPLRKSMCVWL